MHDAYRDRVDAASLPPASRRIALYIDANRAKALASSAAEIGASTGTSDATVVRTAQALGFAGLGDLKRVLAQGLDAASTPAADLRRTLEEIGEGAGRAVDLVLAAQAEALAALERAEARTRIARAITLLHPCARLAIFGIGPSAALARCAAIPLARVGRRPLLLDRTGRLLADQLLDLRADDGLLALAYGRPYREISAAVAEARRLALPTVLVTDAPDHALGGLVDLVLVVPRGRAGRVALQGGTLVALEAIVLGLTSARGGAALEALRRLERLRDAVV